MNKSKYILGFILIILSSIGFSQTKNNYVLITKSDYSNINYDLFECFIQFLDCKNYDEKFTTIEDIFTPTKGEYAVYNFIKTYDGLSYTGEIKIFHDL
ncbi:MULTISPECIES: hypothetical protein [Empedobacter]|uniref:hypothetical protein n=1 Tax=Empedobacter TaxID=59734 RepID=UPI0025C1AD2A|nr:MULTISPECIES: hypothetical protein [unclassified Empedobacter]